MARRHQPSDDLRNRTGTCWEETYINNFRIIGQDPDNNYLVHETFHVTVNANGELTAFVDNFSIEWK